MNEFNLKNFSQWSRMGPRAMFGQFMIDIAKKNKKLIVLSADLGRSSGLDRFKSEFPEKISICWNKRAKFNWCCIWTCKRRF